MAISQVIVMDEVAGTSFGNARAFPTVANLTTCTLANGAEVTAAGSAIQVLAANANRKLAVVQNTGAANVRVGTSGVSATTGMQVLPGSALILTPPFIPTNAIFAIREGGTSSSVLGMEGA